MRPKPMTYYALQVAFQVTAIDSCKVFGRKEEGARTFVSQAPIRNGAHFDLQRDSILPSVGGNSHTFPSIMAFVGIIMLWAHQSGAD